MDDNEHRRPRDIDQRIRTLAKCSANLGNADRVVESIVSLDDMPCTIDVPRSMIKTVLPLVLHPVGC